MTIPATPLTHGSPIDPKGPAAHIRIPNRLYEALLVCGMTPRQFHICHGLLRITVGWGRKTVRIGLKDLAELMRVSYGGSFREQVQDLIREGVIHVDRAPVSTSVYALNQDHTAWGKYTVSVEALARRFSERPTDSDDFFPRQESEAETELRMTDERNRQAAQTSAQPQAVPPQPEDRLAAPLQADHRPEPGPTIGLHPGRGTGSNSANGNGLDERKDRIDRKDRTTTATTAAAAVSDESKFTLGITTAANLAISKKWGEQTHPLYYGASGQLAADLIELGIPLVVAQGSIQFQVERSKNLTPPKSIEYFRPGILQAAQSTEQRTLDANAPAIDTRSHGLKNAEALVDDTAKLIGQQMSEREMLPKYAAELDRAIAAWSTGNALQVAAIKAKAQEGSGFLGPKWVEKAERSALAEACGFPSFDVWLAARQAANVPRGTK